jgi:DNA polymerase-3 subunit alpha
MERLSREFDAVGFYLSGHPLDSYEHILSKLGVKRYADFEVMTERGATSGQLAGIVISARERKSQRGNKFAFAMFSDTTGQFEAVIFSEALVASRALLEPGTAVLLDVEAEADGETVRVRIQGLSSLDRVAEARHAGMRVYVEDPRALGPLAEQVGAKGGEGEFLLVLRLDELAKEVEFELPQGIDTTPRQRSELKLVEGVASITAL